MAQSPCDVTALSAGWAAAARPVCVYLRLFLWMKSLLLFIHLFLWKKGDSTSAAVNTEKDFDPGDLLPVLHSSSSKHPVSKSPQSMCSVSDRLQLLWTCGSCDGELLGGRREDRQHCDCPITTDPRPVKESTLTQRNVSIEGTFWICHSNNPHQHRGRGSWCPRCRREDVDGCGPLSCSTCFSALNVANF